MRLIKLGRTTRLVLLTIILILLIPIYFLNQLESIDEPIRVPDVPIDQTKPKETSVQTMRNVSLEPRMSDSLGNYEPKDLPKRSGPGEGGKVRRSHRREV